MIELHWAPGNASMAPHMLLHALALPHRLVRVDRDHGAHKSPAYLALNPNGLIPVLVDGDLVLYETLAICLHLADQAPASGWMPPLGSPARAEAYKWLAWMSNTLQPTLMAHFYPARVLGAGHEACAAVVSQQAQAETVRLFGQLAAPLQRHGGPWVLPGAAPSLVDLYGWMLGRWTRNFQGSDHPPVRTHAVLGPWLQRVLALPPVQQMLAAEGLQPPYV